MAKVYHDDRVVEFRDVAGVNKKAATYQHIYESLCILHERIDALEGKGKTKKGSSKDA